MPFQYPCYSRLKSNLGRIDAICGYATLAVDLLSEELEQNNSPREWLSGSAKLRRIVLHSVDEEILPHRLAQMFIASVHAQLEEFLQSFLDEHAGSQAWDQRGNGEALFLYVLKHLGMLHQQTCSKDQEITEYYRMVRNRFSHVEVNAKRVENQRKQVRTLLNVTEEFAPPKTYELVDYGDFNLFTRAVKSIACKICLAARPSDEVLAQMARSDVYSSLRRYKDNPTRYRNALQQKLQMDYGLDKTEAQPILELVVGR